MSESSAPSADHAQTPTRADDRNDEREDRRHDDRQGRRDPRIETDRRPDGENGEPGAEHGSQEGKRSRPGLLQRRWVRIGGALLLIAIVVLGTLYWLYERRFESTDDAFIDAHMTRVAPQVAGRVAGVYVSDNELVRQGQLLVQIDPADATARLQQNIAQQTQAQTALAQGEAQLQASQAAYRQSLANLTSSQAQAANADANLHRYEELKRTTPQAVAQEQLDSAIAGARSARASVNAAQQQSRTAAAQINAVRAQLSGAQAAIRTATAKVEESRLSFGYTKIYAPVAGHIAQKTVAVGNYVNPGEQLMAIVPLDLYVTANFKETELADMRPNQPVRIQVDACPQVNVRGHVGSIQRGAGQAFSLLPPENATGNWVKVVQRVPVKVVLDQLPRNCALGPGESVEVRVSVR